MAERKSDVLPVLLAARDAPGWEALRPTREMLAVFGVPWIEADGIESSDPAGVSAVIVAAADATLPGKFAEATQRPVVRVPIPEGDLAGLALLHDPATGDLPAADGAPFATVAIGEAGAKNAALFVVSVLALEDPRLWAEWLAFRQRQTDAVLAARPLSTRQP